MNVPAADCMPAVEWLIPGLVWRVVTLEDGTPALNCSASSGINGVMFAENVRADVQQFLLDHIETHEELAAILLLRSKSDQAWSAHALAKELKIRPEDATEALEHLMVHRLVALENQTERSFKYAPSTQELSERVDRLADAYRDHWLGVLKVLSNNAMVRVRTSAMRAFADSFVVDRKKGPHD